jgi:tripartite ATP-independent transporter DctM subunit
MIPPSFDFIAYSIMARQSIGEMFIAGLIPGAMEALIIVAIIIGWAKISPHSAPRLPAVPWKQKLISLKAVLPVVSLLVFILGSIYAGIATPTEAAGVSVIAALFIAAFYRKLTWRNLSTALMHTVTTSGFIFIILIVALFFGYYLTITGITQMLTSAVMASGLHPKMIMLFIFIVLAGLGCVLDPGSLLFITTPILLPVVSALGFDLVWYGVALVVCIEMGLITPPVGIQLYVVQGIVPEVPISDIIKGSIPFVLENAITLASLLFFPQIALWLPRTMMH